MTALKEERLASQIEPTEVVHLAQQVLLMLEKIKRKLKPGSCLMVPSAYTLLAKGTLSLSKPSQVGIWPIR